MTTKKTVAVRAHLCMDCDHMWAAKVELSKSTTNLSGEKTQWCPHCGGRRTVSSPVCEIEVGDDRVYVTKNVLMAIVCDKCGKEIKPHSDIANSGWKKTGIYFGPGDERNTTWYYCPECANHD